MSQRLKNSPSSLAFTSASVEKLSTQINASGCQAEAQFHALVTCSTTGKDQLAVLKQIGKILKANGGVQKKEDVDILTSMFLHCVARHPMRRSLSSMLQNVAEENKDKVSSTMSNILQTILNFEKACSFDVIRENVDTIGSLMENFPLGDDIIRANNGLVLVYLEESLETLVNATRNEGSPVEQTKIMQHALTTLKTIIAVLQKCETITPKDEEYTSSINSIISHSLRIMCDEYVTLECRCAAAIVFPGVFCHLPRRFVELFINLIYSGYKFILPHSTKSSSQSNGRLDVRRLLCDRVLSSEMKAVICECTISKITCADTDISKNLFDSICSFFDAEVELSSKLVLLHALLVKLPEVLLLHKLSTDNSSTLFNGLFVNELIDITLKATNKNILVLGFKSITLWVEKARHICSKYTNVDIPLGEITTDRLLPHLLLYVDHYIDTIRHTVNTAIKDSFALLSSIHVEDFDKRVSKYFTGVLNSRGHVAMLINICQFVSIRDILNQHTELPGEIVSLLGDIDLASHGCDLFATMCEKHFKEIREDENGVKEWARIWIETLYLGLSDKNRDLKANIVTFLIPSVLKIHPAIVKDILADIETNPQIAKVRAVIVFLRCLRSMKNYVNTTGISFDSSISADATRACENVMLKDMWKNMVRMSDMKKCLTHADDQVRLDALSLICSSVKTTDSVDTEDTSLLHHFLRFNMSSENPSFRHQVLTNMKKICLRMFNHAFQLAKQNVSQNVSRVGMLQCSVNEHTRMVMVLYSEFLMKIIRFVFKYLYESAPYSQTSTSLGLISLLTEILDANKESELMKLCNFDENEKVKFTAILLRCFNDTYEPNRIIATDIFKRFPIFCSFSDVNFEEMFKESLTNLSSPKPDVSSVAAYYITFLAVILKDKDARFLYNCSLSNNTGFYFNDTISENCPVLVLLDVCLNLLKEQLEIAKHNLIRGCQDAPLYGVLYCMRLLFQLQDVEFTKSCSRSNHLDAGKTLTSFLGNLMETGLEIIKIVSPYVSNDAPEGYLCDVSLLEIFKLLNIGDSSKSNIEVEAHVARMLLVCCWRSMKEVSLLIGIIVSNFSNLTNNSPNQNSLPATYILNIWDMFCDILLRSKHAGAYELASLGFIKLCSVLWSSYNEELRSIPANAVTSLVNDLLDPVPLDKAQVTRRSAGLPFYLEALCITEPLIKDKQSFKSLMKSLTDLCEHKMLKHDMNKMVISLNILRAFYKNAKLREVVFPYVSSGVIIAISGFGSSNWAIRNSCTLLFSALMQRIFGVKKCKMTGREFFSRFPRLYTFLLDQAKSINDSLESRCKKKLNGSYHPSLFPVLLLLSHLYPSTIETSNFLMLLDNFIPYVMRCGSNAVYKTRTMAAKALVPLVSIEQVEDLLMKLISQLQSLFTRNGTRLDQNFIHGSLLQFKFVLERCLAVPKYFTKLDDLLQSFLSLSDFCLETKVSFVIKSLYVDILISFLRNRFTDGNFTALPLCLECLYRSTCKESKCSSSPGYALFLRSAMHYVNILFKFTKEFDVLESRMLEELNNMNMEKKLLDIYDLFVLLMSSNDDSVVSGVLDLVDDFIHSGKVSPKVCEILFNYVHTNSLNDKCFAKALCTFGLLVNTEEKSYQRSPQILDRIFDNMSSSVSDETKTAVVKLSVSFILKLDSSSSSSSSSSPKKEVTKDLSNILDKTWKFLEECSKPDQCETCREETVSILKIKPEKSTIFDSCPSAVYRYFNCCIKLLKDPSPHIRDETAEILTPLFDEVSRETYIPQPSYILDVLFKEKISYQLKQDPKQCIIYLISLMLDIDLLEISDWLNNVDLTRTQCSEESSESEDCELVKRFVVYEESKENPYYDVKEICELSCSVLQEFYTRFPDMQNIYQSTLDSVRPYYDRLVQRKNDLGWMD